jgi:hypothetical protein
VAEDCEDRADNHHADSNKYYRDGQTSDDDHTYADEKGHDSGCVLTRQSQGSEQSELETRYL